MVEHGLVKYKISEPVPPACWLKEAKQIYDVTALERADGYQRTKSEGSVSLIKT